MTEQFSSPDIVEALAKADMCERLSFPPEDHRHLTVDKLLREYAAILRATQPAAPAGESITRHAFVRMGIQNFKEHELREIVATFCKLPGIAPSAMAQSAALEPLPTEKYVVDDPWCRPAGRDRYSAGNAIARLVVAARKVAFEDQGPEALRELDSASEAFAQGVPWDDEPSIASPSFAIVLDALTALYAVAKVDRDEDYAAVTNAAAVIEASRSTNVAQGKIDPIELAAWLCALEDAESHKQIPASLIEHGRNYVRAGMTEKHCGDCTNQSHSCVVCGTDGYLLHARQIIEALTISSTDLAGGK